MRTDYTDLDKAIISSIEELMIMKCKADFSRIHFMARRNFDIDSSLHSALSAHCNGGIYRAVDRRLQKLRKDGLIKYKPTKKWVIVKKKISGV